MSIQQDTLNQLADQVQSALSGTEQFTMQLSAESSSFVRFNNAQVRQPGAVEQASIALRLIDGQRHTTTGLTLTGDAESEAELFGLVGAPMDAGA